MKRFFAFCCCIAMTVLPFTLAAAEWNTDLEKAKTESARTGRPIFVLFTNSESAGCIGYDRAIFNAKKFQDYADKNLVLLKVDFPTTIHLQPKKLADQNRKLRAKFQASIPSTYLLDQKGELYLSFTKVEKTPDAHRRKLNEIMEYDPPKSYADYIDPFVKKYIDEKRKEAEVKKKEAEAKKKEEAAKKAKAPKGAEANQASGQSAEKQEDKPAEKDATSVTTPEEAGSLLIPRNPEGTVQDWLKSRETGEAAEEAAEAEEIIEAVEAEKEAIEKENEAKAEAKEDEAKAEAKEAAPAA